MASVYSRQLVNSHATVSGTVVVPTGFVWVVRLITAFYPSALGGLIELVGNSSLVTFWWDSAGPVGVPGQFRYWNQLNLVLPNNENYALSGTGSPDISLSGYELELP